MRSLFPICLFVLAFTQLQAAEEPEDYPVDPQQLNRIIEKADRLVVKSSYDGDGKVLFESTARKDLDDLKNSLEIEIPEGWFVCMCIGDPAIYLYEGDEILAVLTNHHGKSVRFSFWKSNARILNPEKWLAWFDQRNMPGARKEFEDTIAREKRSEKNWDRWLEATPEPIQPIFADHVGNYGEVNTAPLSAALEQAIPDRNQQILALLAWYGSGAGPWSGFPSYEDAAEDMLLKYETQAIVDAIESIQLTDAQTEGAARFFGGWGFFRKRPNELQLVPETLKAMFLNHVERTNDEDKLKRAKRAFQK